MATARADTEREVHDLPLRAGADQGEVNEPQRGSWHKLIMGEGPHPLVWAGGKRSSPLQVTGF